MKNRWIALLLALSVLVCAGCGGTTQTEEDPKLPEENEQTSQPDLSIHAAPEDEEPEPQVSEEIPQVPEETELVWCTDPVLAENEMPGSYRGLELPVKSATGYTSTILPLWASLEDWEAY